MIFIINKDTWEIIEKDKKEIVDTYNSEYDEKASFVFGVTKYPEHEIWINKEMKDEQKLKTLKHELTHCFIWEYGLYNAPHFDHEMVCDLVASINDFINEITEIYSKGD